MRGRATWWSPASSPRLTGLASREALSQGMTEVVPAHRADRISRNLAAVEIGYSWVEREIPNSFAGRRLT